MSLSGLNRKQSRCRKLRRSLVQWPLLVVAVVSVGATGCHRAYYREQADAEAYALIDEKVWHSRQENVGNLNIEPARESRMFDPFDPDRQPMPIDDPVSHQYMDSVDGRRGYPLWDANGKTNAAESPDWWQYLPLDENGVLVLDSDTAVRLALLHSPDYQRQLEQLYLSALDVSSERFRFDTQFFGGAQTFYTADGPDRNGLNGDSSSALLVGPYSTGQRPLAMQRSFATGADLVVGLANSIVWEMSGPSTQSANTVLDFALVQPLLRGAGRDRVMERLTLSERRLLANVRAIERYRRSFYLSITTGRSTESTVQRSGGVFGVGLGGFSGLGGGFAGLSGGGTAGFSTGGGVAQAGGFMGLLQDQLQIENQEENVARLSENLVLLQDTLVELLTTIPADAEAIPRQRLQVAQAQQALISAQTQLLTRRAAYQSSIDSFLGDLGLPPYICTRIEDPSLKQFELIDREVRMRREELTELRSTAGQTNIALLEFADQVIDPATGTPIRSVRWSPELAEELLQLRGKLGPLNRFLDELVQQDLPRIAKDIDQLEEALPARREHVERLEKQFEQQREVICALLGLPNLDASLFDFDRIAALSGELREQYSILSGRLEKYDARINQLEARLGELAEKPPEGQGLEGENEFARVMRDDVVLASQDLLSELSDDVLSLQLIQARARTESVQLPEVDLTPREALEIARRNRRDWANARASLVDSWRLIEFNADDLESNLDITFSGDVLNASDNPLDLQSSTGRLRVGLQWDAPLTRLQERNTYRQSLIEFNQARRSYYQYEDGIWQLLRGQLRQLQSNQYNFELSRQAVRIAADQIGLNEDIRQLREARGLASGPTAARDTISALNDLLNAQNSLLNVWVNYEVVRRSLDLDLGTMELTGEGLWIDPGVMNRNTVGGQYYIEDEGMIIDADPINFDEELELESGMIESVERIDLPAPVLQPLE
ncbi:hypothetical protein FF011L_44360 [Roseimaritima multifibrata]|uniref:Outer membrane efflux protein n=1 Tax=Roseimaritima multifibrata TaxID=1930274 RepID=A0A517ML72_9BACT|nr:hypothetical protein [Roseimaritima multifibrata]QDS95638.1 hypothetical protein FF011L_44360 [Roseimaritima multifibrata]